MVLTSPGSDEQRSGTPSTVTSAIDRDRDLVRLAVEHRDLPTAADVAAVATGWPAVLADLKSLLETGRVLPQAPWEFAAEPRAGQLADHD